MDKYDKGKLKVLIKMVLIQKSPRYMSANQISNFINQYKWGFRTSITSAKVSKLLSEELMKKDKHFLSGIDSRKRGGVKVYSIQSLDEC